VHSESPKGNGEAAVQVRVPGLPKFSVEVNAK